MQPNQLEQIYRLSDKGLSQQKIADHFGLAKSTVWHHLQKRDASDQVERYIVLPDPHVPYHDRRVWDALLQYIEDHYWHGWICLGDLNDFDAVSHWNKSNIKKMSDSRLHKQYKASNQWLDELQLSVRHKNPDGPKDEVLIEGNHDFWIERYVNEHPELEGLVEVEPQLKLQDRGIQWVRYWTDKQHKMFTKGHASFIHGEYVRDYHANKHADVYGTNIFYGHLHDVQSHSRVALGHDKTYVAHSLGCLCSYDAEYLGGRPTKWQQAFGVFHFMPDGHFWYSVVRIFGGRFVSPEGKVYRG